MQDEVGTKNLSAYSKPLAFEIPKQRIPNVPLPITPVILKVEQICGTFLKYDGKYTSETIIMSVIMHALFCTYYISSKDLVSARRLNVLVKLIFTCWYSYGLGSKYLS